MSKLSKKRIFKKRVMQLKENGLVILLGTFFIIASFLSGIVFEKLINQNTPEITADSISGENLTTLQKKVIKDSPKNIPIINLNVASKLKPRA